VVGHGPAGWPAGDSGEVKRAVTRDAQLRSALEAFDRVCRLLSAQGKAVVAVSGGVDSAVLAVAAQQALGRRALLATARSPVHAAADAAAALVVARHLGLEHTFVDTGELDDPAFRANDRQRCYYCKRAIGDALLELVARRDLGCVVEGSTADDAGDWRPGRDAVAERGFLSPLATAGLDKPRIRALARHFGLPNHDAAAESCLAARIPYGTPVTRERLEQVEAAEVVLLEMGLVPRGAAGLPVRPLRVRHHGDVARVEVDPRDAPAFLAHGAEVAAALRRLGFAHVAVDVEGYRRGG